MDTVTEVKSNIDPREIAAREYLMETAKRLSAEHGGEVAIHLRCSTYAPAEVWVYLLAIDAATKPTIAEAVQAIIDARDAKVNETAEQKRAEIARLQAELAKLEAGQ